MRYELTEHTDREREPRGVAYADLATANAAARQRAAELGYTALDDSGDDMGAVYSDATITRFVGVYAHAE